MQLFRARPVILRTPYERQHLVHDGSDDDVQSKEKAPMLKCVGLT